MSNKVNKPALYFSPVSIICLILNERYVCITFPHSTPFLECVSYGAFLSVCMLNCFLASTSEKQAKTDFFFYPFFFFLKSAKLSGIIFNIPCQCSGGLAMHLKLICFDSGFCKMYIQLDHFFVKAFLMRCNTFTFV